MMEKTPLLDKTSDELKILLEDACQAIDDSTHHVQSWGAHLVSVLDCLEFHAMANDPEHPEQYETMLELLRERISARLKHGSWLSSRYEMK